MTTAEKYADGQLDPATITIPVAQHGDDGEPELVDTPLLEHVQTVANLTQSVAWHLHACDDGSVLRVQCYPVAAFEAEQPDAAPDVHGFIAATDKGAVRCHLTADAARALQVEGVQSLDPADYVWHPVDHPVGRPASLTAE